MNILQLCKYYPPILGGIELVEKTITKAHSELNDKVIIITFALNAGERAGEFSEKIYQIKQDVFFKSAPINFRFLFNFQEIIKKYEIDRIYVHLPNPFMHEVLAFSKTFLKKINIELIAVYHSDIVNQKYLGKLYDLYFLLNKNIYDYWICSSEKLWASSPVLKNIKLEKKIIIPFCVDSDFEFKKREKFDGRLLAVGRLVPYKGFEFLIETIKKTNYQLDIIGDGADFEKLKKISGGNVIFHRKVGDVEKRMLFDRSDLLIISSINRSEAYGMTIVEAFGAGLPVVASDLESGVTFLVQHEKTGLIFKTGNERELIQSMKRLENDSNLYQKISLEARKFFDLELTYEHFKDKIKKIPKKSKAIPRVLYISPNGYQGGAERFVLTVANAHKGSGNFETGILFFSNGEACNEAQKNGIKTFILKNPFRMRNIYSFFSAIKEIRKIVINYKPDILHLTMPYSHIVLSLATLGLNIRKVWFQHGPVGGRLDQIASFFPVDMIWYNSNYLKMLHHKMWPKCIIREGEAIINLGTGLKIKQHELFTRPVINIGAAGRICSDKGFENIIIALGELKKEKNLKAYNFFLAGSAKNDNDKKYARKLVELVKLFNLTEEVKFLSHVENMEYFYHDLDIFIHSSVTPEPFGLVVAEAMKSGCLVVGSNCGGVSDFLKNGKTGLTFSSTSKNATEELKKILEKILNPECEFSLDIYSNMANQGKEFIEINYSVDKMITQIESIYSDLLKKTK